MAKAKILPDIADLDDLGGVKLNSYPIEDPDTDLDSKDWNEVAGNVSALTRTAPRAFVKISFNGTPDEEAIVDFESVWGDAIEPVLSRTSKGVFNLIFDTSVSDLLIESGSEVYSAYEEHDLAFRAAFISCNMTAAYIFNVQVTAGNEIDFSMNLWDGAGISVADPIDTTTVSIVVY